jgi:CBS domain containing-hemolysin-like protein
VGDGDVDTIGGYVIQRLARWPRAGDSVELGENYRAKVVSVANKRVKEVLITPTTQEAAREDGPGVG